MALSFARREQIAATDTDFVWMVGGATLRHAMHRVQNLPGDSDRSKAFAHSILGDLDSKVRSLTRMILADLPDLEDHTALDDEAIIGKVETLWPVFINAWPDMS